jgi:hypothetical protein
MEQAGGEAKRNTPYCFLMIKHLTDALGASRENIWQLNEKVLLSLLNRQF